MDEIKNTMSEECALQIKLQIKSPTAQTLEKTLLSTQSNAKIEDIIIVEYK